MGLSAERIFIGFCLVAACAGVCAAKTIGGRQAERTIGALGARLSTHPYYAVKLERRNKLPSKDFVDAVIFTPLSGRYRYIRRQDADHRIILNATASAQEAVPVRPEDIPAYEKLITADALVPYAVKNKEGKELAVIYCALKPCFITDSQRPSGEVVIELRGSLLDEREELERTRRLMGIGR